MPEKPIVYVSSSVTLASNEFREFIKTFKQHLRAMTDAAVIDWVEKDHPFMPDDFMRRNFNNVRMSDAVIVFVDNPSIGVGMEIQDAVHYQKPIFCLYREGTEISRLLLSMRDSLGVAISPYRDIDHAVTLAADFVMSLAR